MNTPTQTYIRQHANDDVRRLALSHVSADVDLREALQQIEGRQLAAHKLPACAANGDFLFPTRLSLEQCSSEATARYKLSIVERLLSHRRHKAIDHRITSSIFYDFTGGLGIDFIAIAPVFQQAVYIEHNPVLCELACHNLPVMHCQHAQVLCEDAATALEALPTDTADNAFRLFLIDPARRDVQGKKVALIQDCTPDVCQLQDKLRQKADYTLIKLSPMLDLTAAIRAIRGVTEVHIVSVEGECKELLLVMSRTDYALAPEQIPIYCIDLYATLEPNRHPVKSCFQFTQAAEASSSSHFVNTAQDFQGHYLYEPHASILKAGAFRIVGERYALHKLAPNSHLYLSDEYIEHFPGRCWRIVQQTTFAKKELKQFLSTLEAADLTVRGFPMSTAALRKQLHLREGGTAHLIATTLADNKKILFNVQSITRNPC